MLILHHLYIYVKHTPRCIPGSLTSGFLWSRCWGYHSQHSWRMRNPQFTYLVRGPWYTLLPDLPKVCQFPFRYKGEDYDECTDKDRPHPWCATNPECEEDCDYSDKDNYGYCFIGRIMWLINWPLGMWLAINVFIYCDSQKIKRCNSFYICFVNYQIPYFVCGDNSLIIMENHEFSFLNI